MSKLALLVPSHLWNNAQCQEDSEHFFLDKESQTPWRLDSIIIPKFHPEIHLLETGVESSSPTEKQRTIPMLNCVRLHLQLKYRYFCTADALTLRTVFGLNLSMFHSGTRITWIKFSRNTRTIRRKFQTPKNDFFPHNAQKDPLNSKSSKQFQRIGWRKPDCN